MATLQIINLHAKVEDKEILKGVNLTIKENETLALLGPNGHGKSTLLSVIMGHPKYEVTEGQILLDGQDVLSMSVDERSRAGLFLAMQYPSEVPGVINSDFLKAAMNARREKPLSLFQFYKALDKASSEVKFSMDMVNRSLNEGFSGGEKKRNEIFQMMLLNPSISMLDEIDSGLDVDAISIVSDAINKIKKEEPNSEFLYIGTSDRMEKDLIPELGIKYEEITVSGLKRKLTLENFKVLAQFLKARNKCKKIIKEEKSIYISKYYW